MELTHDELTRVNAAIVEAERATSGEIFVVVARRSGSYGEVPVAYGAGAALLLPLVLASLGMPLWELVGVDSEALSRDATLLAYSLSQFVVFGLVAGLVAIRPVRMALAPEPLRRARVNKRATELFLSKGLHLTERRTGVLLFASLADRHATIIADDAVRGQMASARWAAASDALDDAVRHRRPADGLVEAVRFCGHALAEHHPAKSGDLNELPDEVVLI